MKKNRFKRKWCQKKKPNRTKQSHSQMTITRKTNDEQFKDKLMDFYVLINARNRIDARANERAMESERTSERKKQGVV